ncbi:MAG TPA: PfkB family carbohydrate kinase [Longimicrobiaceae bacterium]|nr:PfkB family carbohydrate kinase [Longimicrobiaceae bacterium]
MERLTPDRLDEILGRTCSLRVAVVGDVMLDVYLEGTVTRISPEAPVPVVNIKEDRWALGGAANVAANIVTLGADCDLLGYVGADDSGLRVRAALTERSGGTLRPRLVERPDRPTTTKTRVMARSHHVIRFDRERDDDLPDDCVTELCALVRESVAASDALVLEDYNKGVLVPAVIRTALEAAERAGIPSVVDPKFRHFWDYRGATVFKPNAVELGSAMGEIVRPHDDVWLEAARARTGCRHLLLTLGEEGMVLRCESGESLRIPTVAREVYDVSGAGDTVTAFLAVGLAAGASIEEAAILANFAAGIEVGKHGVAVVAPEEVRSAVAAHRPLPAVPVGDPNP